MAVNAGLSQFHKNVHLMGLTRVCSAKLLTFHTEITFQTLLYMVPCHGSAQHSVPDDCSLQSTVSEEYRNLHSVLFFEPPGTFRLGRHARMTYVKTLLRDSGLSTIADLSQAMASRAVWRDICDVVGVDVDASTVSTYVEEKRRITSRLQQQAHAHKCFDFVGQLQLVLPTFRST